VTADGLSLPEATLATYLEAHVPGFRGPLTATKFKGGQSNPTYRIAAASGSYVLRRKPPGQLLPSAHAVDREFRVLSALHGSSVPVAQPLHLCRDDGVIGSMFYLMERVDGRVYWDPALPDHDPAGRGAIFEEMVRVLAAIHAVDVTAAGLADYGKPGNYFARQIARWTDQYRASQTGTVDAMEHLIAWLPTHCPTDDGTVGLVHGDFRIDNMIFDAAAPRVRAVVDWELSTLGHPLADLAYLCMALRLPRNPSLPGLMGMDRAVLGIPDEERIVERYRAHGGRVDTAQWRVALAFNFFRLAAIAQGVYKRSLQGNASSEQAATVGRSGRDIAALGAALTQAQGPT
jgi:aminoglycoside phosphotransferase (APT) family kinase protein